MFQLMGHEWLVLCSPSGGWAGAQGCSPGYWGYCHSQSRSEFAPIGSKDQGKTHLGMEEPLKQHLTTMHSPEAGQETLYNTYGNIKNLQAALERSRTFQLPGTLALPALLKSCATSPRPGAKEHGLGLDICS